jgi:hypothetical protein
MKKLWILFLIHTLLFASCNAQNKKNKTDSNLDKNKPIEDIRVNKEYDENGNLIRFDSTYTYYYSNIENNPALEDSIFKNFRKMFSETYPFSNKPYFNELFFQDSLLMYDFYNHDFFTERFRLNMQRVEKLFMEMDSIKNKFFEEQFKPN